MVKIDTPKPPLSEARLVQVEEKIGIRLPEQYRRFLLKYNGGQPIPASFHYKTEAGPYSGSMVDWFLAIYDGEYNNFESWFELCKGEQPRVPANLVPIAHDPGGNLICISVSGSDQGAVYFWDHENEAEDEPDYRNVHLIDDTFDEFLAHLKDSE